MKAVKKKFRATNEGSMETTRTFGTEGLGPSDLFEHEYDVAAGTTSTLLDTLAEDENFAKIEDLVSDCHYQV